MSLQTQLQSPYSRDTWTGLQQEIFGSSAESAAFHNRTPPTLARCAFDFSSLFDAREF